MAHFVETFTDETAYSAFTGTSEYLTPNVSVCSGGGGSIFYNPYVDYSKDYFTLEALEDNTTFTFRIGSRVPVSGLQSMSYSTDSGMTWTTTNNTTGRSSDINISVTANTGEKVLWKGIGIKTTLKDYYDSAYWSDFSTTTKAYKCYGNIMSLIHGDDFSDKTILEADYTFENLFYHSSTLSDASNLILPATALTQYCYSHMFLGCTSLTTAPELPATTLAYSCYGYMFYGCTSLTTVPELPATTLANSCYDYMFYGCTSLETAPELPATALTSVCYQNMFDGCTSLATAPELPATTLADSCYYQMFQGCTRLTTAPELPATTLTRFCYRSMFKGCTSLTSAPELPATTLAEYCYERMFQDCRSLNSISCLATKTSASNSTTDWVNGVASSGTFTKASGINWPTGTSGIPTGWTVVVKK